MVQAADPVFYLGIHWHMILEMSYGVVRNEVAREGLSFPCCSSIRLGSPAFILHNSLRLRQAISSQDDGKMPYSQPTSTHLQGVMPQGPRSA